jgi:cytochrome b subunit of formate dehydrogenase
VERWAPQMLATPHLESNQIWYSDSISEINSKIEELSETYTKRKIIPSNNLQWLFNASLVTKKGGDWSSA